VPRGRAKLVWISTGLATCCLASPSVAPAQALGAPNVVLIVTDDQRWDTVSEMPIVTQELVRRGVTFTNAFAVNPLCCPSRASILTGRYSHSTRVWRNAGALGLPAFQERSTLATWLRAAGYRTGFVGKYLNGYLGDYVPVGWNRWVAFAGTSRSGRPPGYYDYDLNVNGTIVSHGQESSEYSTDVLAVEAETFIRRSKKPFFLLFSPFAPHYPASPAPRHADAFPGAPSWRPPSYDEEDISDKPSWVQRFPRLDGGTRTATDRLRVNQLRSLLAVDEAVGRLVRALEETGQLANTVIVFTSDNGHFWGEHRLLAKMAPYEESIRVPLLVRYDALVPAGRVDPGLVANVDLAPTLAELAGVGTPKVDGRSLAPLLANEPAGRRTALLVEHLRAGVGAPIPSYCGVRGRRWIYVAYGSEEEELYDLRNDPAQLVNRATDPAAHSVLLTLRSSLLALCQPAPPGMVLNWICTVEGTQLSDRLFGGPRADGLCGRGGADVLVGRAGSDRLVGGSGPDRLYGGPGADRLPARDGYRDRVICGPGNDRAAVDVHDRVASDCEIVARR
jgi:N-acetylglucosamine-6-sulfatase